MSIVSVDNIQPIGSGTTVTVNKSVTLESGNTNITGVCTATSFVGSGANLTSLPSQVTITNNANDRIFTGGGGTNLVGESGLTFNGNNLAINASSDDGRVSIVGHEGYGARLSLIADQGDDHIDQWNIRSVASNNTLTIDQFGGGTFNTRLTIASDANNGNVTVNTGNLIIGTSGKGIDFSATANAGSPSSASSEVFDDYEEGSWTPGLSGSSSVTGQTYTSRSGYYTKIGNRVYCDFSIVIGTKGSYGGTYIQIVNLPFTVNGGAYTRSCATPIYFRTLNQRWCFLGLQQHEGAAKAYIFGVEGPGSGADGASNRSYPNGGDIANGTEMTCSFSYLAA